MSLHLIAQVWALTHLEPQEKFILLAYADSASAWPPDLYDTGLLCHLARKTGYPVDEVRTVMHALGGQPALLREEQRGLVTIHERSSDVLRYTLRACPSADRAEDAAP